MLSLVRPSREWVNSDNRRQLTEDAGQMGTTGVWSAIGRQFTRRPSSVVRPLSSGSFTVWTLTAGFSLERDDFSSNRHPALLLCLSMIFSKNRYQLFGITL